MEAENNTELAEGTKLTDEEAVEREMQLLLLHGDAFVKLLQFDRFRQFLELNYKISLNVTREEGAVYDVTEVPPAEVVKSMEFELDKIKAQQTPEIIAPSASEIKKFL